VGFEPGLCLRAIVPPVEDPVTGITGFTRTEQFNQTGRADEVKSDSAFLMFRETFSN
jgi:hypothetical protein